MTDNAAAGLENHRIKSFKNKGRDVEVGGSRGGPRPGLLLLPLIALLPLPAAPEEEEEEEGRGRGVGGGGRPEVCALSVMRAAAPGGWRGAQWGRRRGGAAPGPR